MHYPIVFFGVKDTSETIINFMNEELRKPDLVVTLSAEARGKTEISGEAPLKALCERLGIPVFEAAKYKLDDDATNSFFKENSFDLGIVVGWQRLIPSHVLNAFSKGIFGFHGNAGYLPFGRGRSPLNWSILLGDTRFNLNLFRYDEHADSPNVFATEMFSLTEHDNIRTATYKNLICTKRLIAKLIAAYDAGGEIPIRTESRDFDSWYEKRTAQDGKIDWHARTREIYNLVRAVSEPFPGAYCYVEGRQKDNSARASGRTVHPAAQSVRTCDAGDPADRAIAAGDLECPIGPLPTLKAWEVHPFDEMIDFHDYAPGEIIDVFDGKPVVRTVDGSLLIDRYECDVPLKAGMMLC
ncbi:MAG: hypothetical protein IK016_10175 [Lachnospiraceae bacterium]|nr:hypothetical protein [Lachnospiraceae bacterium]